MKNQSFNHSIIQIRKQINAFFFILELYFQGAFQEWGIYTAYSNLVIGTIKFHWINVLPETLELLIRKGFSTDFIGSKKIVRYLVQIDNSPLQEKYLPIYASLLTPSSFEIFSDMDYSVCNVLIAINFCYKLSLLSQHFYIIMERYVKINFIYVTNRLRFEEEKP